MAILGSIIGGAIAGGTAAGAGAGAASSALASAITAATATGASTATAAGAGSALTGALTAATSAGAGAAGATAGGSAVTGAITAATGGVTGGAGGAAGATTGGITAAGLGKAAAVGAIKGSLINAGATAAQGGSAEDILKAGATGAATGAATGLFSGAASSIKGAAQGTAEVSSKATVSGQPVTQGASQAGGLGLKAPGPAKLDVPGISSGKTPGSIPNSGNIKYSIPASAGKATVGTKIQQVGSNIAQSKVGQGFKAAANSKPGQAVGKVAGQFGVQGALSLLSMGQAAKQANAANKVSQQNLQFQQQTYNEQKAEREEFKAGMKQTAQTAYESSLLFGEQLQGSDASSTLLTSYGAHNTGDYSILTYSSSRSRDKT